MTRIGVDISSARRLIEALKFYVRRMLGLPVHYYFTRATVPAATQISIMDLSRNQSNLPYYLSTVVLQNTSVACVLNSKMEAGER